ncbi:MAG TPA: NAD(P)-dependent oxidoreductase [Actinocrinis sp.]|nr:NAD(P)-dependent oxidoreductase [Actinocrinis sp.]
MAVRIVVTGAAGRLGQVVVELLESEGMDVLAVDRQFAEGPSEHRLVADLQNLGQVYGALAGADAVVHLAAVPSPGGYPAEHVFGNNTMAQFHVFEAAARLGVRRVVSASSFSAYGFPFQREPIVPDYLPLDEDHPLIPQDPYGLSKVVGEQIAASFARRNSGTAVSLRFSRVLREDMVLPLVQYAEQKPGPFVRELWSYIHVRDAARACLAGLTAQIDGHVIVHASAADTLSATPSEELARRWLPQVPVRGHAGGERWPLVTVDRAEKLLGFVPEYSWTTAGEH